MSDYAGPDMAADTRATGLARPRLREGITEQLVEWIHTGTWRPGSRTLTETQLAESLGVSRPTLREALRTLEEDSYLRRVRGSGTFVTHRPHPKNNPELNFGVSELIRSMGMRPGTESPKVFDGKPTVDEIRLLELSPDTPVVVVERVRTADGTPVVFSRDVRPRFLLEGGQVIELIFRLTRDDVIVGHALQVYDTPVVRALSDAVAAEVNRPSHYGLDTWDDTASLIHEAGIPAVPHGPGSNHQAHAVDEQVPTEQPLDCAQALARGARNWLHQPVQ